MSDEARSSGEGPGPTGGPGLPALSPVRAAAQLSVVVGAVYLIIYGGAWLGGGSKRFENPLLSVSLTAAVMLLLVALFSARDPQWRSSLLVEPRPWREWLPYGVIGVMLSYGVNITAVLVYTVGSKLLGGHPEQLAVAKAQWASQLGGLSLLSVVPLALLAGVWEEIVFRGFVLGRARVAFGRLFADPLWRDVAAVALMSVAFGLGHGYQGPFGLAQTGMVGATMAALVLWRKSLWPAVFAHLSIDTFGLVALHVLKPMVEKLAQGKLGH